ncbi:MAG: hypothetical protein DIJKHBIC_01536 [Thermoanaerobaculia bacterium]|nr:hypothetical protein [Thermoanaerobaculia bacterium]
MTTPALGSIGALFASDIRRRIEEVIKVDQTDDQILHDEIAEYVVTDAIRRHYTDVVEKYAETPAKPHEGIAVWVSGFFGSGKSSFAKILGLALSDRPIAGGRAGEKFAERTGDNKIRVLLKTIAEKIPTHAVIFDVSTDRGIKSGNQTLTEIMYRLFLQSLGYSKDLDLSEMEIALEEKGELPRFEAEYERIFRKSWNEEKGKVAFALSEASRVLHTLDPATYPMADSWVKAVKDKADITPGKLAERATELMKRRRPGQTLLFVVDEVGQFVARDVQKMLDLQAVVQNLGVKGRGKHWVVVTSQEKLDQLVSGLDDKKIELARLMDRFPQQVHLEPSDISEVTSRRVLTKNAAAQAALGKLFDDHRGRLAGSTRLSADIRLPELTRDAFVDLYPLLPYHIDLIIQVVSGLRTQGGAGRHVGGANRTIIKLAQQILINPAVNLADQSVGTLARLDQVYDLVEGNIGSEVRAKIASIPRTVDHPFAQSVAKAICLLQYVRSVHRTAENIAATLHPSVTADSQLASVKEALRELESAHLVRHGDDGYRIPTPAEDDWERTRIGLSPKPGDIHRLHSEVISSFWQPQPSHTFLETKAFKAGLAVHGRVIQDGDLLFHIHLADDSKALGALSEELRQRSREERRSVFWAVGLSDAIDRETVELFRSRELIERKEREARTQDQGALISEEKQRQKRHLDELRRLLRAAFLSGSVSFRGNDRSPSPGASDVGKTAGEILAAVLPELFERFKEAAAKTSDLKRALDALLVAETLNGLPAVFAALHLLRIEKGKNVFRLDDGPLAEVLRRIEERAAYGETASGRWLAEKLAEEPFGWDFEAVRLFVLCLLRAGKIAATSKGQSFDAANGPEAKETFSNNNFFRAAAFRPKKGIDFAELARAAQSFRDTFGVEVTELAAVPLVADLRREVARHEETVASAFGQLRAGQLPGWQVLDSALGQMKAILRGSDEQAVSTFNTCHKTLKDAIKRGAEIEHALTESHLALLERARRARSVLWPFLKIEAELPEELPARAESLADLLERETFFKEFPAIEQQTKALEAEYKGRREAAQQSRIESYAKAIAKLGETPGWEDLDEDQRTRIEGPLRQGASPCDPAVPIPQLRSEREACEVRLKAAVAEVRRLVEGDRLATIRLGGYFGSGIETEEQLEAALTGIREECSRLIGAGKKIVVV